MKRGRVEVMFIRMQSSSTSMPDNNRNFNWYEYETSQIGCCLLPDVGWTLKSGKEETREFFRWLDKCWIWEEEIKVIYEEYIRLTEEYSWKLDVVA
jgi:hypothetical protein